MNSLTNVQGGVAVIAVTMFVRFLFTVMKQLPAVYVVAVATTASGLTSDPGPSIPMGPSGSFGRDIQGKSPLEPVSTLIVIRPRLPVVLRIEKGIVRAFPGSTGMLATKLLQFPVPALLGVSGTHQSDGNGDVISSILRGRLNTNTNLEIFCSAVELLAVRV